MSRKRNGNRLENAAAFLFRLQGAELNAREIRDATPEAQRYQATLEPVAKYIQEVAGSGDLPLMLKIEQSLQIYDLEMYAKNEKERGHVIDGLRQLDTGLRKYEQLTETPEIYQKDSLTYYRNDRDNRRDVPRDGMRKALASQNRRLQNRMSLTSTEGEKGVLSARISLIKSIEQKYAHEQEKVIHGTRDDNPSL